MSDEPSGPKDEPTITRRGVLAATGTAATGLAAFTGTAAAHEVSTVAFCGCSQVTVYGAFLLGRDGTEGGLYEAVLYCDGEIVRRTLTGTQTRQNYDVHADDSVGDDCQIIALEGTTYDAENNSSTDFTICNTYCPANCAAKGLADQSALDDANVGPCEGPGTIQSGGSDGGIAAQTITVLCRGCGRDEPGQPGAPGEPGPSGPMDEPDGHGPMDEPDGHGPPDGSDHPGPADAPGPGSTNGPPGRGGGAGRGRGP